MRKAVLASLALIAVQFLAGLYLYPVMPERMAIHWGLSGGADGYGSRLLGLFLVPSISALFFPFFLALPRLDPSRGINGFKGSYDWFVFGFLAYMAYVNALMLAWNLGWRFGFMRVLAPAVGAMLYGEVEAELVRGDQDAVDPEQRGGLGQDSRGGREAFQGLRRPGPRGGAFGWVASPAFGCGPYYGRQRLPAPLLLLRVSETDLGAELVVGLWLCGAHFSSIRFPNRGLSASR
jgi:hypothetical protein